MNPARIADAEPEDPDAVDPVPAVGIGPGSEAYLAPGVSERLREADVVVGFETVTERVEDHTDADVLVCGYDDQSETVERFADRVADGERGVAVLWGDPNVSGYQFLGRVERALDRPVRVVPGVSSIQVVASRARTPLERSTFASLHRRGEVTPDLDRLAADAGDRHLIVLVRPYDWMPPAIATGLLERGVPADLEALVLEELTLPGESIERTTLGDLAAEDGRDGDETNGAGGDGDERYSDRSILVVRAS